jgi:23S rRNA pseudouridine2605 synthase
VSVRLNKLLAQRGVGARRKCDALIQQGLVRVNGRVERAPGLQVEPERDLVTIEGKPLAPAAVPRYYVLNKPVGVITTLEDPEGRRTVREFLPPGSRLFPVGRLDADTSGLLILTNDGELAHRLMHPRYGVTKVYRVHLDRAPSAEVLHRLQEGVEFEPGVRSAPARVRAISGERGAALLRIELHEGRYRQVRRMCEAVGLGVRALHRSAYGPLRLGPVPRGMWRELSDEEVRSLREASARPRWRGQQGYRSPRTGGDAARRLARRLERLAREGRAQRVLPPEGERAGCREPRRPIAGARSESPRSGRRTRQSAVGPGGGARPRRRGAQPRGMAPAGLAGRGPRGRRGTRQRGAAPDVLARRGPRDGRGARQRGAAPDVSAGRGPRDGRGARQRGAAPDVSAGRGPRDGRGARQRGAAPDVSAGRGPRDQGGARRRPGQKPRRAGRGNADSRPSGRPPRRRPR